MEREGKVSVPKAIGQLASVQGEDPRVLGQVWGEEAGRNLWALSCRLAIAGCEKEQDKGFGPGKQAAASGWNGRKMHS